MTKKALVVLGGILMLALLITPALAAEVKLASEKKGNITLAEDDSARNLYTAGNIISINGLVEEDLIAVGNIITVNGPVEDDLMAAGSTVVVRGMVGGSARLAGGNVVIDGNIEQDLILAGGNITISESSSIEGDLLIAGGNIDLQAPVKGFVRIIGGLATINSSIGGKLEAEVDELILGEKTIINGDLIYKSKEEAEIAEGAVINGEIDYQKQTKQGLVESKLRPERKGWFYGIFTLAFLWKMIVSIALGLVLVYLFRRLTEPVVKNSLGRFWVSISYGFSALILVPVAIVILFISLIGAGIAGLLIPAYAFTIGLAFALAPIIFGSWLIKIIKKEEQYKVGWPAVVIGVIVAHLVMLIPIVNWLVGLIFVLIGLGALYRLIYQSLMKKAA